MIVRIYTMKPYVRSSSHRIFLSSYSAVIRDTEVLLLNELELFQNHRPLRSRGNAMQRDQSGAPAAQNDTRSPGSAVLVRPKLPARRCERSKSATRATSTITWLCGCHGKAIERLAEMLAAFA